jgi:hypothetical protein
VGSKWQFIRRDAVSSKMRSNLNRNVILLIISAITLAATITVGYGTPTSTAPYTSITLDQYSSTAIYGNGLSLTLSLNSTTYHPGEQATVTIHEKNTLATENNIPVANRWPVQNLNLGPCGTLNYPFGISILRGYYDAKDVGDITPLQLFNPNVLPLCPMMLAGIVSYDFQPESDIAVIHTNWDSEPGAIKTSINMTAGVTASGFWTGSHPNATFSNFTPGIYTVVGGDEWGALVVLHFTVT